MEWPTIIAILLLVFFLIITILGFFGIVSVEISKKECDLPQHICNFGRLLGFPENWLRWDSFIWYAVLPLAGIALIVYGFLDRIKIFENTKINFALAFLIAFSLVPLGAFTIMVAVLFSIMGGYAVIVFFILFIFGVFFLGRAIIHKWEYGSFEKELGIYDEELKRVRDEKKEYEKELKAKEKELEKIKRAYEKHQVKFEEISGEVGRLMEVIGNLQSEVNKRKLREKDLKEELKRLKKELKMRKKGK